MSNVDGSITEDDLAFIMSCFEDDNAPLLESLTTAGQQGVVTSDQERSERMMKLIRFLSSCQAAMNGGDFATLKAVIDNCCTENIEVHPPSPRVKYWGRDNLFNSWTTVNQYMPDVIVTFSPAKRCGRVISVAQTIEGTIVSGSQSMPRVHDSFNPIKRIPRDPKVTEETYNLYCLLESQGKSINLKIENYVHMILNIELNYIEKAVSSCKSIIVSESRHHSLT